ncbi:hypothetical protein POX_d05347 [Penicillium oxalicum]|uniref:Hydrophobin n=1 Tax=Penicillium oxalicum (strain 114-2 / CGMCC 5302) TaxID=933388 RepID=S8B129_PENO1|nr:hypothetical protein POX_d05347 [Penicillium oxalicum]EPS32493.1 hypothetical protein PDE_07453 [Penicillium oxalicum 114-2]KAI2789849.1 hypothetical protein POX_d05347 [Penicillium oxalicum]
MPSLKSLLLPLALAIAATSATAVADDETCPKDWLPQHQHGGMKCCYGNKILDGTENFCCVYDMSPVPTSSVSTATEDDYAAWATAGDGCVTRIPFTASNYSDLVSSASSKIAASRTAAATNEASATTTSSSLTASPTSLTATPAGSQSTAAVPSTTENAALPMATAQDIVLGGAAVVVGLLAL